MNGLLLLNKALGHSSNRAMQEVKRLLGLKKIGHTGSLDPLATGMLPLCLGEATKFAQYLLDADKSYEVTGRLGIQTTTGDIEGQIIAQKTVPPLSQDDFLSVLLRFHGTLYQTPPMYSALKHRGQPLYRYALQGIDIERPPRMVNIYRLELISYDNPLFTVRVSCSKGTYMRTLIEDIGHYLNCGAHVVGLHRLSSAGFKADDMLTFDDLAQLSSQERLKQILPMEVMVLNFPRLDLDKTSSLSLHQGQVIQTMQLYPQIYRVYHQDDFFGLAEYVENKGLMAKRLCQFKKE